MTDNPDQKSTQKPAGLDRLRRFARGSTIFREGDSARFAYIVTQGTVGIFKRIEGVNAIVTELPAGTLFGEMAVIDGKPRSATAQALTDVTVREIDRALFLDHIRSNPHAALNLMIRLSEYVRTGHQSGGSPLGAISEDSSPRVSGAQAAVDVDDLMDTEAIWQAKPKKLLVSTAFTMVAFVLVVAAWLSFTFVDVTVSGRGQMVTLTPNVSVQASLNSAIVELRTSLGSPVAKGDVLMVLDGTVVQANLTIVSDKLAASENRLTRLIREQDVLSQDQDSFGAIDLGPVDRDILVRRVEEYRARIAAFDTEIAKLDQQIEAQGKDITLSLQQVEVKREIEKARDDLNRKGLSSRLALLNAQEEKVRAQREHQALISAMESKRLERASVMANRSAFAAEWMSSLATEIAMEEEMRLQLFEERTKLRQEARMLEIKSPVQGIVLDIEDVSIGSLVSKGEPLLSIVQTNVPLVLEVDVDPKDVADLRPGQIVSVKLDALPFQQFGDLAGRLSYVSTDTYPRSLFGKQKTVYRARVELQAGETEQLPQAFRLTPGMMASADMKVGKRRLATYFVNPIIRTLSTAFREPD